MSASRQRKRGSMPPAIWYDLRTSWMVRPTISGLPL
jgi:hypothetical protein